MGGLTKVPGVRLVPLTLWCSRGKRAVTPALSLVTSGEGIYPKWQNKTRHVSARSTRAVDVWNYEEYVIGKFGTCWWYLNTHTSVYSLCLINCKGMETLPCVKLICIRSGDCSEPTKPNTLQIKHKQVMVIKRPLFPICFFLLFFTELVTHMINL